MSQPENKYACSLENVIQLAELELAVKRARIAELEAKLAEAQAMADELEQSALSLNERLKGTEARERKVAEAAGKVYQLRNEAPAGDRFTEFYTAVIRLGNVLKEEP